MFDGLPGAVLNFAGDIYANDRNRKLTHETQDFNAEEAKKNRDFQEEMRKTQYQTAVGDMKAAGLNPMLAYSQGGAGTPNGSSASGQAPTATMNPMSKAIDTKLSSSMNAAQIDQVHATTEAARAQAAKSIAEIDQIGASAAQLKAQTGMIPIQLNEISQRIAASQTSQYKDTTQAKTIESQGRLFDAQRQLATIDQKYRQGQIDQVTAQTALTRINAELDRLKVPEATNKHNMETSEWGQYRHYIPDAAQITNSAGGLLRLLPNTVTDTIKEHFESMDTNGRGNSSTKETTRKRKGR